VPFVAEALWQNLAVEPFGARVVESVHLCDYPTGNAAQVDEALSRRMALAREIVSLGRSARMDAKLKVRQPLARVEVVLADATEKPWLEDHAALIAEELNVKSVDIIQQADQYITYTVLPDLKRLGPRLGKRLPALKKKLAEANAAQLLAEMQAQGRVDLPLDDGPVTLDSDDLKVRLQAKEGWSAAQGHACVVVLSTAITEELKLEGLAREVVHAVQTRRKELDCQYTDRIAVGIETESRDICPAVERFGDYIRQETLAVELRLGPINGVDPVELDLGGHSVKLYVKVVKAP